ncbi:MAG: DUF1016 N-terminal domain-containing protein [Halobacteriota archaeon]
MTEIINKSDYKSLLDNVSTLIEEARRKAVKQVNTIIVQTYWEIGSLIVEEEQNCELITIKDDLARSFYEIESIKNNWSVREIQVVSTNKEGVRGGDTERSYAAIAYKKPFYQTLRKFNQNASRKESFTK